MKKIIIKYSSMTKQNEESASIEVKNEDFKEIKEALDLYQDFDIKSLQEDFEIEYSFGNENINIKDWFEECFSEVDFSTYYIGDSFFNKDNYIQALELLNNNSLLPYCEISMNDDLEFWLLDIDNIKIKNIKKKKLNTKTMN